MDNIGIIVAMQEELIEILKIMDNVINNKIYEIEYITGSIEGVNIVVAKSGVGKVNAARTAQIMIDKLDVKCVINVGSAGALNPELNIGDIVIGDKLVQHDFDITAFNHKKGYISGVGDYISTDKELLMKLQSITNSLDSREFKVVTGVIASGDIFCTEIRMKDKIYSKFNAQCVEMEGAAIAQVCQLDNVPCLVIRSISDSPNENNAIIFEEFVKLASSRCAIILKELLKEVYITKNTKTIDC